MGSLPEMTRSGSHGGWERACAIKCHLKERGREEREKDGFCVLSRGLEGGGARLRKEEAQSDQPWGPVLIQSGACGFAVPAAGLAAEKLGCGPGLQGRGWTRPAG